MTAPGRAQLRVVPVSWAEACTYVDLMHRHHARPQGHKFSVAVAEDGRRVGVAMVGRPVARALDDGWTLEVTRVATDGTGNACSALYGAAWRAARALGYRRLITYTDSTEPGTSPRAAGFQRVADRPPRRGWDTPSRRRKPTGTEGRSRVLWEITCRDAPPTPGRPPGDETRDETAAWRPRCRTCRKPIRTQSTGRPANYCSPACRQAAYRSRHQPDHHRRTT